MIFVSAFLYTSAFVMSLYAWLIFIAYTPLFYTWYVPHGARLCTWGVWGAVVYGIHWLPFARLIIEQGEGGIRYLIPVVGIGWLILTTGLVGYGAGRLRILVMPYPWLAPGLLATIWWGYTLYIYYYAFGIVGYTLSYPLVPLAAYPCLLYSIRWIPSVWLMGMLIVGQAYGAAWLYTRTWQYGGIMVVCLLPFIVGIGIPLSPDFGASLVYQSTALKPLPSTGNAYDDAQGLTAKVARLSRVFPVVILPETAFAYDSAQHEECIALLQENIGDKSIIIFGTHQTYNKKKYVAACCLQKERVQWRRKTFLLPFGEYTPVNSEHLNIRLFHYAGAPLVAAPIEEVGVCTAVPGGCIILICAELFCDYRCWARINQLSLREVPLVVLVNDSWAQGTFLLALLARFAQFKAVEWRRPLVYVSHTVFYLFNSYGQIVKEQLL